MTCARARSHRGVEVFQVRRRRLRARRFGGRLVVGRKIEFAAHRLVTCVQRAVRAKSHTTTSSRAESQPLERFGGAVLSNESEKLILEAWRREADRAQKRLERFEDQLAGVVTLSLGTAVIGIGAVGYVGQHKGSPLDFMPIAGILLLGIGGVISIGARLRVQSSTKSLRQTAASTVPAPSSGVDGLTTLQKLAKLEESARRRRTSDARRRGGSLFEPSSSTCWESC